MTLENIASVTAGQIMTRVTADKDAGNQAVENVKVWVPKAIVSGVIVKEDLGKAELGKQIDEEKYTHEGDVVIKLSTPYDAAYVNEENAGIAIPSFCAAIRITDNDKMDAMYLTAFLNSSHVRDELTAKVVGSARPMIKITDIRALEVPELNMKDMQDIGKAFVLSGLKKATLQEMIDNKVMLYRLLFKYLELKKEKFSSYDEKFSLGYLSLTYGKLIDSKGLLEYVSAVEKEFRIEEGVLRESFDSAIEKADAENVRIIFEEVNNLKFEENGLRN